MAQAETLYNYPPQARTLWKLFLNSNKSLIQMKRDCVSHNKVLHKHPVQTVLLKTPVTQVESLPQFKVSPGLSNITFEWGARFISIFLHTKAVLMHLNALGFVVKQKKNSLTPTRQ